MSCGPACDWYCKCRQPDPAPPMLRPATLAHCLVCGTSAPWLRDDGLQPVPPPTYDELAAALRTALGPEPEPFRQVRPTADDDARRQQWHDDMCAARRVLERLPA
jgi:hypothetical protein